MACYASRQAFVANVFTHRITCGCIAAYGVFQNDGVDLGLLFHPVVQLAQFRAIYLAGVVSIPVHPFTVQTKGKP